MLYAIKNTKPSDVKRLARQQLAGQPVAILGDNQCSGFSCSFVIFISKTLIALTSPYLPDDVHSFTQC